MRRRGGFMEELCEENREEPASFLSIAGGLRRNLIAHVEERRSRPFDEAELVRILAELQSPDEVVRARAVRQLCPCQVSWEVFDRLRKIAQQLQRDPSPLVRANARHVEEDAREVLALEALWQRVQEAEEETGYPVDWPRRRGRRRRCRAIPA